MYFGICGINSKDIPSSIRSNVFAKNVSECFQVCITALVVLRDMLSLKAWLRNIKNAFTQHSQPHRRKITMLTIFNVHLFFLCISDKLTL